MDVLLSIKSKLKPLGLYKFSENSLINAELESYCEGLNIIYQKLTELERECFISTATSYGIEYRQKLFGPVNDNIPLANKRESLIYKKSINSNSCTKSDMEKAMSACGMNGYIIESKGTNSMSFNCIELVQGLDKNEAKSQAQNFLPIHLNVDLDFSELSWIYIDNQDLTFSEMDSKDFTWNQIDNFEE